MFFWKKSKKVVVDAFCLYPRLAEFFPIEHARKISPYWYEKAPAYADGAKTVATIKLCPGFQEISRRGLIIPLWKDHHIAWDNNGLRNVEIPGVDAREYSVVHEKEQWPGVYPGYNHVKLVSPWMIKTERPIQWHFGQPMWHAKDPLSILVANGVLEFHYQHMTHLNLFLPPVHVGRVNEVTLEAGTPIIQMIPLEDIDIDLRIHEATEADYRKMSPYPWTRPNLYAKTKKLFESKTKSKCPFSG
jgi:hypothetical protein